MTKEKKYYAAPMEGLTGFAWRKAHHEVFGGADKYYTPFVVANQTHKFKTKELRDLTQEEENLIPQILTDKAEHFIWAARELKAMGYEEVNFNLGCPSATVVTRGKGSGILRDTEHLDIMLDEIYTALPDMKISIKTRIGFEDKSEWPAILDVYNRYPLHELIIHTRLRSEFYEGIADKDIFSETLSHTDIPLIYNGDITGDIDEDWSLMAGRGLLRDPALFRKMRGGRDASKDELIRFHNELVRYYSGYMDGDGPVIHHMKSLWVYWGESFEYEDKVMKKLKKAKRMSEYMMAANEILKG